MPDGSRQPTRNLPCVTRQYLDVCPTPDMRIFLPKCHSIDLYQTFSETILITILHEDFIKNPHRKTTLYYNINLNIIDSGKLRLFCNDQLLLFKTFSLY